MPPSPSGGRPGSAAKVRPPSPYDDPGAFVPSPFSGAPEPHYAGEGEEEEYDDDIGITEMALVDHASRFGTNPEDLIVRSDPVTAEEMRDRAMQQFLERQASLKKSSAGGRAAVTPLRGRGGGGAAPASPGKLSPLQVAIERKRRQQAAEAGDSEAGDDDGELAPTEQISAVDFEPAPARVFPDRDEPDAEPLSGLEELANLRTGSKARGVRAKSKPSTKKAAGKATAKAPSRTTTTAKATAKSSKVTAKSSKVTGKPAKAAKPGRAPRVTKAAVTKAPTTAPAKKAPAKAAPAKKAPAKKAPVKTASVKKVVTKKASAKKR
ncbi:MAG: hypothetical protein LC799_01165 [Actinobacteria bacterium]|nr:hypothetical protein [Actinomycetota bacterium]